MCIRAEREGWKVLAERKRVRKMEYELEAKSMSMSPWAESNKLH